MFLTSARTGGRTSFKKTKKKKSFERPVLIQDNKAHLHHPNTIICLELSRSGLSCQVNYEGAASHIPQIESVLTSAGSCRLTEPSWGQVEFSCCCWRCGRPRTPPFTGTASPSPPRRRAVTGQSRWASSSFITSCQTEQLPEPIRSVHAIGLNSFHSLVMYDYTDGENRTNKRNQDLKRSSEDFILLFMCNWVRIYFSNINTSYFFLSCATHAGRWRNYFIFSNQYNLLM